MIFDIIGMSIFFFWELKISVKSDYDTVVKGKDITRFQMEFDNIYQKIAYSVYKFIVIWFHWISIWTRDICLREILCTASLGQIRALFNIRLSRFKYSISFQYLKISLEYERWRPTWVDELIKWIFLKHVMWVVASFTPVDNESIVWYFLCGCFVLTLVLITVINICVCVCFLIERMYSDWIGWVNSVGLHHFNASLY